MNEKHDLYLSSSVPIKTDFLKNITDSNTYTMTLATACLPNIECKWLLFKEYLPIIPVHYVKPLCFQVLAPFLS